MDRYFIVSLCRDGILGGDMVIDADKITYQTGKVTVPEKFRHLELRYENMEEIWGGWKLFFPTVTFKMKDSEEYKFIIFAKRRFLNALKKMGVNG